MEAPRTLLYFPTKLLGARYDAGTGVPGQKPMTDEAQGTFGALSSPLP